VTPANNRAVALIEGIRENLRVLLVSGRTARRRARLAQSAEVRCGRRSGAFHHSAATGKTGWNPISELSLIAFPTRELFVEKIDEFDLIIFDRYQNRGVLPVLYYDYIARYVEDGGALLVAAGPELAGVESIAETPLAPALPAMPTGEVTQTGFIRGFPTMAGVIPSPRPAWRRRRTAGLGAAGSALSASVTPPATQSCKVLTANRCWSSTATGGPCRDAVVRPRLALGARL
jgi:hypothetical protein